MPKGEFLPVINQRKRDRVVWADEQGAVLRANNGALELLGPKPKGQISNVPHKCVPCGHTFNALRNDSKRGLVRCPKCRLTSPEKEILALLTSWGVETVTHDRSVLGGSHEIDLFVPTHNVGIEYHGLYWHKNDQRTHAAKHAFACDAGIRLIQIYSDEWENRKDAVTAILRNALSVRQDRIGARKLRIVTVDDPTAFYEANHVQGAPRKGGITYGLMHGDDLVACMSFNRPYSRRKATGPGQWELTRYATSMTVQGGASRLWTHFLRQYEPTGVVSYSDQRYFTGGLYETLGFTKGATRVNYEYSDGHRRWHKSNFQKSRLKKMMGDDYDDAKTELQLTESLNLYRVWDAGRTTWHYGATEADPQTDDIVDIRKVIADRKKTASERKSAASRSLWQSEEHRTKMAAFKATLKYNEEFKQKVGEASRENWTDPAYREKVMKARSSAEALEKRRAKYRAKPGNVVEWTHPDHGTRMAYHADLRDEFGGHEAQWLRAHKSPGLTCRGWSRPN